MTTPMSSSILGDMLHAEARGRWVRLRTLVNLRWVAVAGQTVAVLAAARLFHLELPLFWCFAVIAAAVCVNLVVVQTHQATTRLSERNALLSMLFDLAQLVVLLALTGGLANPMALLILAPVTIAASVLTLRTTMILASVALASISLLMVFHQPLRFASGDVLRPSDVYIVGVWAALTVGVAFTSIYTRRIAVESFRMSNALAAAQVSLAREQRLTAIGGLAAAAAHELGTPLATIKLISGELARDLADRPEMQEDLRLLRAEADRCREILADLGEGGRDDAHVRHAPISALVEEAARPHRDRGKAIVLRVNGAPPDQAPDQPIIPRRPEIVHGLRNLIQNAADFAAGGIWIDVRDSADTLRVAIGDDGPGFGDEVLARLGDPFVTTRGRRDAAGEGYQGMGLGLFIAKTLLERTGARLTFANGSDRGSWLFGGARPRSDGARPTGAVVEAAWTRRDIVADLTLTREPLGENPRFTHGRV